MTKRDVLLRMPLIAAVGFALLAALYAALQRVGWSLPTLRPTLAGIHGPLMIGGVLGTLIALERAAALRQSWAYLAPLCSGLGGVLLVLSGATIPAQVLILAGSFGLTLIFAYILRRHVAVYTGVMSVGVLAWLAGNVLWLTGMPVYAVVHLWIAFLVLTIVGERLELSRVTRLTDQAHRWFLLAVGLYMLGVSTTVIALDLGVRFAGVGQIALAVWLLRYDIARHTVKKTGLTRYIAVCLLAGYVWLGVGGLLSLYFGAVYAGYIYDALLHAVLLGFVFSMIFGHAPIIFPALTGQSIVFTPLAYGYLALLHGSLLLREIADLTAWADGRQWGGLLNVTAVIIFIMMTAYSIMMGRRVWQKQTP